MKIFIQDTKTKEYYGVECTENPKGYLTSVSDIGSPNNDDMPYWTDDIDMAYDFETEALAKHELRCNDLTCDGKRDIIIKVL